MTTRSELITSILSSLHSYSGVHETVTQLSESLDAGATTFSVQSADGARRGMCEIDDELLYVNSIVGTACIVAGFGRGYRSSVAASHTSEAMVTWDPAFPRFEIGRAINQAIRGLFPALYQVKEIILTASHIDSSYELPADVESIIRVETKWLGDPKDYWNPIIDWELEKSGTPQLNLALGGMLPTSAEIRVVYAAQFGALTTSLEAAGIPESYEDLLTYAVTSRMIRFLEPARLQLGSVENVSRAQVVPAGEATRAATQLYALYQQRVAEERRKLLDAYPIRPQFLGR